MKNILIVDDDRAIVDLLVKALSGEGRAIRFAYDGESALAWFSKDSFDLLICDLMMPRMHGLQLIEKVKSDPECRNMAIIMLTAKSYQKDAAKAMKLGAAAVLTKPFDLQDLRERVKLLLS